MEEKQLFIQTLELLRKERCAYFSLDGQRPICDCKMRIENEPLLLNSESGNGCVELSLVIHHINKMTDEEYNKFRQWN